MTLSILGRGGALGAAANARAGQAAAQGAHAGHGGAQGGAQTGAQTGWSASGGYRPGASAGWSASGAGAQGGVSGGVSGGYRPGGQIGAQIGGQTGGQAGWRSLAGYNGRIAAAADIPNLPRGWSTYGFQTQTQGQTQHSGPQPGDEQAAGIGGRISNILPPGSLLGRVLGVPMGAFSYLVGHDSALRAAQNGDVGGWLVNTQSHEAHTHALGGNAGGRQAPLAFLGTLGQEAGYMLGLDGVFGNSAAYDRVHGTNYNHDAGQPTHVLPIWGERGGLTGSGYTPGTGVPTGQQQAQAQAGGGAHAGH
ncbi:hypothetical protein [Neomegalonema perideroedes]|uniref:hypothetical protein n=1 Tax=Neomegalonema perideroedes TaxID=217219 RepID=UPI0003650E3B|nr:hypothetical protein [Neomegalonema perideroedes]